MKRLFEKTTVCQNGTEKTEEHSVSIVSKVYEPVDLQGGGIEYTPENLGIRKDDGAYMLYVRGLPDGIVMLVVCQGVNGVDKRILSREWKVK